mmetsp:Transcript_13998/g.27991  ORF Transcript_13998/g.27991 Transcript_13998/m.27991 type:complete len:253 (+) Transcript_13998:1685-2443(+)
MDISRPVLLGPVTIRKLDPGEVVSQSVEPHVHDVFVISRYGYAPCEGCSRDRKVLERLLQSLEDFVSSEIGFDELRVLLNVLNESLLVFGHSEEIGGLLHALQGLPCDRVFVVVVLRLCLWHERFLSDRVPTFVVTQVNVSRIGRPLPQPLAHLLVAVLGRADVVGVAHLEGRVQVLEALGVSITDLDRLEPLPLSRVGNFLSMFICACEKEHVSPERSVKSRQHICGDDLVSVSHVGESVRVVDRSGDVEL